MKNKITVKAYDQQIHFYLLTAEYGQLYLCSRAYTPGVYDYFRHGRLESELYAFRKWNRNPRLDKTISRLPAYIKYALQMAAEDALWESWQPRCAALRTEAA